MNPDRRQQIEQLFETALELPANQRQAFLADHCGRDLELRAEVEALLAGHDLADGPLERPAIDYAAGLLEPGSAEQGDRHIGPYRVLRELGRGGMGVVYLAERDDGHYRRRVAVKLVPSGLDDGQVHRRFLAERQILASLNHPNIAQLLDGGVADGQLPYLVMEYVEGQPITEYCDRHRLNIDARLRLFLEVCSAVHHAHQNLIIHRDLKPSNIVVAESHAGQSARRGVVKLLDFGIAKLLNPSLGPVEAPLTRLEQWVMTPEYASPEQVRGEPLSTASDVYSLGVILYELLTGHRPYTLTTRSPEQILELVCRRDPDRPSTRAAQPAQLALADGSVRTITPASVSQARDMTPERLQRRLRGDLDAIVMMALRKEAHRRYGSADMLGQDIQRHLDGLPVLAHSGSAAYRAHKFLSRHRAPVSAAALAAVALLAGSGTISWQAAVARAERDRAELAVLEAEAVSSFLMGMFEASNPDVAQGDTITARELLERGIARAEALSSQPLVQARMLGVVGRVYSTMGEYDQAQPLLERALQLQVAHRGANNVENSPALAELAELMRRRGLYDSAYVLLQRTADLQRTAKGGQATLAETFLALSRVAVHRGQLAEAERWSRDALALHPRPDPGQTLALASLRQLASVLRERGDYPAAEAVLRDAIELRQASGGRQSVDWLPEFLQLADLLQYDLGQHDEPERIYRQALTLLRATPDPDQAELVRALGGLARILESRGEPAQAELLLREALDLRRRTYGPRHPLVSAGLIHLAGLFERTRRFDQAEALFREVAELDRQLLGEMHPTRAGTLTAVGRVLIAAGRFAAADTVLEQALAIRVASLGGDHPLVARTMRQQAEAQLHLGRFAAAESMLQHALSILLAQRTPEANTVRDIHSLLAELYMAWDRPADAQRHRDLAEEP